MASCSISVVNNNSKEHVDLLGDTKNEIDEWSHDYDDHHVSNETRPFEEHELA